MASKFSTSMLAIDESMFEIDEEKLVQIHHSRFGGLYRKKTKAPSDFSRKVLDLLSDFPRLKSVNSNQMSLAQANGFIRFFYWLFNIDNYAVNAYLLAACRLHNPEVFRSLNEPSHPWTEIERKCVHLTWTIKKLQSLGVIHTKQPVEPAEQTSIIVLNPTGPIPRGSEAQPSTLSRVMRPIKINPYIEDSVATLGIQRVDGEFLSWEEFKQAFFLKARKAHPDRGGSEQEFGRINTAAEKIRLLFLSQVYPQQYTSPFSGELASFERRFLKEMADFWAKLEAREAVHAAEKAAHAAELAAMEQRRIADSAAAEQRRIADSAAAEQRRIADIAALKAEFSAQREELMAQMRAMAAQFSAQGVVEPVAAEAATVGGPGLFHAPAPVAAPPQESAEVASDAATSKELKQSAKGTCSVM